MIEKDEMMQHDEIVNLDEALTDDQEFALSTARFQKMNGCFWKVRSVSELSDFMKTLREKNGITQTELAKKSRQNATRLSRSSRLVRTIRWDLAVLGPTLEQWGSDFVSV